METFEGENMETPYSELNYKIDLYFHEYKLAVEIDENNDQGRNENYEKQRQKEIENKLSCVFIRINPEKENFNISRAEHKIFRHIKKSLINDAEKLTKMVKQLNIKELNIKDCSGYFFTNMTNINDIDSEFCLVNDFKGCRDRLILFKIAYCEENNVPHIVFNNKNVFLEKVAFLVI